MRVLIVDDHQLFAEAIQATLQERGYEVAGIANDGRQAMEEVVRLSPDMILLDIGLPDGNGLDFGRRIMANGFERKIIAVTALEDPRLAKEAIDAGFDGYLTKDTSVEHFVTSIAAAARGDFVVSKRLARAATSGRGSIDSEVSILADQLTQRERTVLALLAEGVRGEDIGKRLGISPNTVRTHVQSILTKLQVHSRLEAASFAVRHGIVDPPRRTSPSAA